jgi:hypothetical protein
VTRTAVLATVLQLAACGRIEFATHVDAAADCWNAWRTGAPNLAPPQPVAELASGAVETDPSLSPDGRTLYFDRGTDSSRDIFTTTRTAPGQAWTDIHAVASVNVGTDQTRLSVSADGNVGVLAAIKGTPDYDLYEVRRASPADAFSAPMTATVAQVNIANNNEVDPELSADGLRMYLAPVVGGMQHVSVTSRPDLATPFAPPVVVEMGSDFTFDPTVSPDERVIVYSRNIPRDLWLAVRDSPALPFAINVALTGVNTPARESDPELSSDGCELLFVSDVSGNRDIYRTTVAP